MRGLRDHGFTLIELMIVVAILSVVAVLAVISYGRYVRRAARSEVIAMLGEIRVKEEAYNAENGGYYGTTTTETTFDPTTTGFKPKTPTATTWSPLGIKFPRSTLYCGYNTIAGTSAAAPSGTVGAALIGTTVTNTPVWFYARAGCDFDNNGTISYFNIAFNTTAIQGL
jgi:prepilin-type N-terminal cleavage/methylation domain-containing protein